MITYLKTTSRVIVNDDLLQVFLLESKEDNDLHYHHSHLTFFLKDPGNVRMVKQKFKKKQINRYEKKKNVICRG